MDWMSFALGSAVGIAAVLLIIAGFCVWFARPHMKAARAMQPTKSQAAAPIIWPDSFKSDQTGAPSGGGRDQ